MKTQKIFSSVVLTSVALSIVGCQSAPMNLSNGRSIAPQQKVSAKSVKLARYAKQGYMPGEMIVKFRKGASASSVQSTMKTLGLSKVQSIGTPRTGINLMKVRQGGSMTKTLQALKNNPSVQYAEPNYIVTLPKEQATRAPLSAQSDKFPQGAPNDEMFERQYAHKMTSSVKGWGVHQGSDETVLAIIDTGVDHSHPDLAAKMVAGYDFVDDDADAMDVQGHGTHCAGIAAASTNNGIGVAGYAPKTKIMPVRVLDGRGSGTYADVTAGILWAANNGADVISMSLGGGSSSAALEDAIKVSLEKDVVILAASGNGYSNRKSYPAAIPGVMSIGATDNRDKKAGFSQWGSWMSLTAPGVGILATFPTFKSGMPGKDYGSISGTSMATPAAAGLAALVRSKYPELDGLGVRAHMEATADDLGGQGFDEKFGHGRINVFKALSTAPSRANTMRALRAIRR